MHYIQKHILDILRTVDSMHYAEMNQDEIESGHFRYHLLQLIKDGYIASEQRGIYHLTPAGEHFVDLLSEQRIHASPMPKVITYTLLRDGDTLLLQEKPKEPYLHLVNMIGGKLHYGETSVQAAAREVAEKTGVRIPEPELRGIFEVLISNNHEVFTHVIAYVHQVEVQADAFKDAPVMAIQAKDASSLPTLAPDFMPIYSSLSNDQGLCTDIIQASL